MHRKALPTTVRKMKKTLRDSGFRVSSGRKHDKITHPSVPGRTAVLGKSPSDHRWAMNLASELRRSFGIDIRNAQ